MMMNFRYLFIFKIENVFDKHVFFNICKMCVYGIFLNGEILVFYLANHMIVTCAELSILQHFSQAKKKVQTGVSNIRYLFIYYLYCHI
jgi:hypothetical protein